MSSPVLGFSEFISHPPISEGTTCYLGNRTATKEHVTYPVLQSKISSDGLLLERLHEQANLTLIFTSVVGVLYENVRTKEQTVYFPEKNRTNCKNLTNTEAHRWLSGDLPVTIEHSFSFPEDPSLPLESRFAGFYSGGFIQATYQAATDRVPQILQNVASCFFKEPWGAMDLEAHQSLDELPLYKGNRLHTKKTSFYRTRPEVAGSNRVCIEPFTIACHKISTASASGKLKQD